VLVAEYWHREEIEKPICMLKQQGTGETQILNKAFLAEEVEDTGGLTNLDIYQSQGWEIVQERTARSWEVKQYKMTGAELLPFKDSGEKVRDWPGKYIPIIPIYGDEIWSDGKRWLRSLTRDAQDPTRNFNYWRSAATELVALAPRVPFIGPVGSFDTDRANWSRSNKASLPVLEYDIVPNSPGPQRQPLDVGPAGSAMQEAMNASDDKKRVMGLYDASLGAKSNETSGKAIMARQREGDVSTFHFVDNQRRAIRHTGRVIADLIPHVYGPRQVLRIRGEDEKERMVKMNQPVPQMGPGGQPQMQPAPPNPDGSIPQMMGPQGPQPIMVPVMRIYDLSAGKYDITVKSGPSFTSRREEAATQLTEALRSVPQAAPMLVPEIFKNLDLPGADEIGAKLEALAPKPQTGPPPEMMKQMEQAKEAFGKLNQEKQGLEQQVQQLNAKSQAAEMDRSGDAAQMELDREKQHIEAFRAETERTKVLSDIRLQWAKLGVDAQMGMQDFQIAHTQAQQHGIEKNASGDRPSAGQGAAVSNPSPPPPSPMLPQQMMPSPRPPGPPMGGSGPGGGPPFQGPPPMPPGPMSNQMPPPGRPPFGQ
jgi:hypothetical protein